jgi:hypothetical protein
MGAFASERAAMSGAMGCCFMRERPVMMVRSGAALPEETRVQTVVRKRAVVPALVESGSWDKCLSEPVTMKVSPSSAHSKVAACGNFERREEHSDEGVQGWLNEYINKL